MMLLKHLLTKVKFLEICFEWFVHICAGHSTTKPYACDKCDFVTAYETGLAKHKYNVHEADHKLFQCELCHMQLRSKGTYVEHIGRHFNHRKKICEICAKAFPSKCCLGVPAVTLLTAFICLTCFFFHGFDTVCYATGAVSTGWPSTWKPWKSRGI